MCLVTATSASWGRTWLWVGSTLLSLTTLDHHLCEVDISTQWILVESFTRVVSRRIWGVSKEGLERVEVRWRARGGWVPSSVNFLLGLIVPQLVVELKEGKAEIRFMSVSIALSTEKSKSEPTFP
jgi:hypothetical protein